MEQDLLTRLAPRLKGLAEGGYERTYIQGKKSKRTSTHQLIGSLLDSLKIAYKEDALVPGAGQLRADFLVNGTWVFVDRVLDESAMVALEKRRAPSLVINRESLRSDRLDHGIRVLGMGEEGGLQTIFLDDPSFNFDYAHILPKTEKCSVMHGHTSSVLVEVVGRPIDGMVIDFGTAKGIVREAVRGLDHKLFIHEKYVTVMGTKSVTLRFKAVHGDFAIQAPKATTVLLSGEATVENLAKEVLSRIAPRMPRNVTAVGVYVYEGLNKGSHLVAQLHQAEVERPRKKR